MTQVALVTGAAQRIGREIALRLAREGWEIGLHYRSSSTAAQCTRDELLRAGAPAVHLACADLQVPSQRQQLIGDFLACAGRLDALICSAAAFEYDDALSAKPAQLERHVQTNFLGPVELITTWTQLRAQEKSAPAGHAVVLLDQKLYNLNPDYFSYTLSKLALGASVRFLAQACAPWVRVNAVAPGVTLVSGDMSPEDFQAASEIAALGQSSTPADIAAAVWVLQTLKAATGQTLVVDGGQHLVPRRRDVAFAERPLRENSPCDN